MFYQFLFRHHKQLVPECPYPWASLHTSHGGPHAQTTQVLFHESLGKMASRSPVSMEIITTDCQGCSGDNTGKSVIFHKFCHCGHEYQRHCHYCCHQRSRCHHLRHLLLDQGHEAAAANVAVADDDIAAVAVAAVTTAAAADGDDDDGGYFHPHLYCYQKTLIRMRNWKLEDMR